MDSSLPLYNHCTLLAPEPLISSNGGRIPRVVGGKPTRDVRTWLRQTPIMLFSQLNNDVILEIFLQFVAIDWDGPFTLILVCSDWSNPVLSQPRLWTWIMIDETQPEWRDRMEVGAHLSKNLPLQIVLRVPFETQVSLSHITRRCTSLFVDSKHLEDHYSSKLSRSWVKTITSYEKFTRNSAELKQSNDSLLKFLKEVDIDGIQIRNEDREHTSFAYSAWHVYERLNQRVSVQEAITSGATFLITALVFKHSEFVPYPRIQVLVTDLWGVLPLLSNLCYLELADSYIWIPKNTMIAQINLRSLQTLKTDSPMTGSAFFSLEDDFWLNHFSLLDTITAQNLEDLSLHGSLHGIVAAMIKACGRFHLLQLNITISVFEETIDREQINGNSVWHGLRRCTIDIPEQNKARRQTDDEVVDALRLLFNLIPVNCCVQLHGNSILDSIVQSDLLMDVELHIVKRRGGSGDVFKFPNLRNPRKVRSLSLTGWPSLGRWEPVPWINSVEELWVVVGSTLSYPYGGSSPIQVLCCAVSTRFEQQYSWTATSEPFSNLRDIEGDCELAVGIVESSQTPQLRSLTLLWNYRDSISIPQALGVINRAGDRLPLLDTLGIHGIPEWESLLPFVSNFNRSRGRGISTVKLLGLPHPAILYHFGRAFRGEANKFRILRDLFDFHWDRMRRQYPRRCRSCAGSGWSCDGRDHCSRWCSVDMVTITADMTLNKYVGDWGPDGQGWEAI